ncbi:hypothetical protein ACEQ8H_008365 [Pleosporales sp. CAS-2024a]
MAAAGATASPRGPAAPSAFERLPTELGENILSYLVYPRSRLPGLTEAQSSVDFDAPTRSILKRSEDLTSPADHNRWAVDIFRAHTNPHPLQALSHASRRCQALVEAYCAHLLNVSSGDAPPMQNPSPDQLSVQPRPPNLGYRHLWFKFAPRRCIYCSVVIERYPFKKTKWLLASCGNCFFRQALSLDEIEHQYHIPPALIRASPYVRMPMVLPDQETVWALRTDVEAMALQLYGTRAFHEAHPEQLGKPCSICAITRFTRNQQGTKHKASDDRHRPVTKKKKPQPLPPFFVQG